MHDPSETPPGEGAARRHTDYEDPHFHDDDEIVASDDASPEQGHRPPARRKPVRLPPRRRYPDD